MTDSSPAADGAASEIDFFGVFNAFAQAMRNDYVDGARMRAIVEHQGYLEDFGQKMWKGEGYAIQFAQYLESYLLAFGNPAVKLLIDHGRVPHYPAFTWGMRVRATSDALYVTQALPECALRPGDRIVDASVYAEPSFHSIEALRRRFGASLVGTTPERELWDPLLHYVNRYLVELDDAQGAPAPPDDIAQAAADGTQLVDLPSGVTLRVADGTRTRRVKLNRLPRPAPGITCDIRHLEDGVALLTLRDLTDEGTLASFFAEAAAELDAADALVIDVRDCHGGTETALTGLLGYVVDAPTPVADFMELTCLTNHTPANARRQAAALDLLAASLQEDDEALGLIAAYKTELLDTADLGLVEEPCEITEPLCEPVAPRGRARKVALLTDVGTCDAADLLAEMAHTSSRCVTVGRATRGSRGYFNPAAITVDGFSLQYPVSRFTDEGLARHFAGCGVPAQIPVPWTPRHCTADPDLDAALTALR